MFLSASKKSNTSPKILTKTEFDYIDIVDSSLEGNNPAKNQEQVFLSYTANNEKISVDFFSCGIITLFKPSDCDEYFLLGIPGKNTDNGAIDLQACIGDNSSLENDENSITETLDQMIKRETHNIFSLGQFKLSPHFIVDRHAEWKLCYVKTIAISTENLTLEELKQKVSLFNQQRADKQPYGIYRLEEIVKAAKKTASLPDESSKLNQATDIMNYVTGQKESYVILDDRAVTKFFERFDYKHPEVLVENSVSVQPNYSLTPNYSK